MAEQGLAYARALAGSAATYTAGTRERVQAMWAVYRPTSLLGWTAFAGMALLATSAFCTAATILTAFLLWLCWMGVVLSTILVSISTVSAMFVGTATFFFSGFCAVVGTSILSCACGAYVLLAVVQRLRVASEPYLSAVTQRVSPATPGQIRPLAAPKQACTSPTDTTAPRDVCSPQAALLPASAAAGAGPVPVAAGKPVAAAPPATDAISMSKHAPSPALSDSASSCAGISNGTDVAAKVSMLEGQVQRRVAIA